MQDAGSGSDSRTGIPVRRTPASAVDAMRLGLQWLAHEPRDARTLTRCPNRPAALPQVNSSDRRGNNPKAKRGPPIATANAVRLACLPVWSKFRNSLKLRPLFTELA